MNCRDFEMTVTSWVRAEVLEETREQCLAHTESCARCAARLAGEKALHAGVLAVVGELAAERASARVEVALLLAFQEHAASGSRVLCVSQERDRARWIWAAAAVLAIVSSIVVWLHAHSSNENNAEAKLLFGPPAPTTPPPEQIIPIVDQKRLVASGPGRRTLRRPIRRQEPDASEIATDFMPLMEGDDLASLDSSQLVRVELPGSALIAVGLRVDVDMADAPVKADVLLGHDGLARAIRFVR